MPVEIAAGLRPLDRLGREEITDATAVQTEKCRYGGNRQIRGAACSWPQKCQSVG